MICFSKRISKDYALEISMFHKIRKFKDGVTFVEFTCNLDLFKGDHNPKFTVMLILVNFTIFEIDVYNVHHVTDQN